MKKIHINAIVATFLTALLLTGCGGGDSSSNSSAPENTTNTFNVTNETSRNFARASIQTRTGAELYNEPLECQTGQTRCMVYYTGAKINEPVALVFYDKDGKTVSAFPFPTAPSEYFKLYTSDWQTGFYLAYKLNRDFAAKDGLDRSDLDQKIHVFFENFDSPDGKPDEFEEIGQYYKKQMADAGVSESQFLEAFYKRLANDDVASQSELAVKLARGTEVRNVYAYVSNLFRKGSMLLISEANANTSSTETASCSSGFQSFLSYFGEVASLIPVVGDTVAAAAGIGKEYCDGTSNALDRIESKLTELQNSVDKIDQKLSSLLDLATRSSINNQTKKFESARAKVKAGDVAYENFLTKRGLKSLSQFFASKEGDPQSASVAGWRAAISAGGKDLTDILKSPLQDSGRGWGNSLGVLAGATDSSDISTYTTALKTMCASPTDKPLAKRQLCNLSINESTATLVASQGLTLVMLNDIYTVLAKYELLKENDKYLVDGYDAAPGAKTFAVSYAKVVETFKSQNKKLSDAFITTIQSNGSNINGYFEAYAGLDATLMKNVTNRFCANPKFSKMPNITDWVYDDYIQTECANIDFNGKRETVKARYYYKSENSSDVANVLGVLVPRKYVNANCDYKDYVKNGSLFDGLIIYPGNSSSNFNFNSQGCSTKTIIGSAIGKQGDNGVLYPVANDSAGNRRFWAPNNSQSSNTFYNWVRLKGNNNFNYVFYLYVGGTPWGNYGYACVTADCSTGTTDIKFKNGPSSINLELITDNQKYPVDLNLLGRRTVWKILN